MEQIPGFKCSDESMFFDAKEAALHQVSLDRMGEIEQFMKDTDVNERTRTRTTNTILGWLTWQGANE